MEKLGSYASFKKSSQMIYITWECAYCNDNAADAIMAKIIKEKQNTG